MKQSRHLLLTPVVLLSALATAVSACRQEQQRQYATVEVDTAAVARQAAEQAAEAEPDWMADDGDLMEIPDIPEERDVDMGASDYELRKMMMGQE